MKAPDLATNRQHKVLRIMGIDTSSDLSRVEASRRITKLFEHPAHRDRWYAYVEATGDYNSKSDIPYAFDPAALDSATPQRAPSVFQEQKLWRKAMAREVLLAGAVPFFDEPLPTVQFEDRVFVFTGEFAHGKRRYCEELVKSRGGTVSKSGFFFEDVDYLVVGELGSSQYTEQIKGNSYGTKELLAIAARHLHGTPAIISEKLWLSEYVKAAEGDGAKGEWAKSLGG